MTIRSQGGRNSFLSSARTNTNFKVLAGEAHLISRSVESCHRFEAEDVILERHIHQSTDSRYLDQDEFFYPAMAQIVVY